MSISLEFTQWIAFWHEAYNYHTAATITFVATYHISRLGSLFLKMVTLLNRITPHWSYVPKEITRVFRSKSAPCIFSEISTFRYDLALLWKLQLFWSISSNYCKPELLVDVQIVVCDLVANWHDFFSRSLEKSENAEIPVSVGKVWRWLAASLERTENAVNLNNCCEHLCQSKNPLCCRFVRADKGMSLQIIPGHFTRCH